jgi:hypothetical protein
MQHAYINGFFPQADGTIVRVYEETTFGTPEAKLVWEGRPDSNGMVSFAVPRRLSGKQARLTAIGGRSLYVGTTLPVSRLGIFHTVTLQLDRVTNPGLHDLGLPHGWGVESQRTIQGLYRSAKYKNYVLTAVFIVVTVASPFIGLAADGYPGLAAGCGLSIASLLLGNYATGFSRGL